MSVTFILGGARSGKSKRAEAIALSRHAQPLYLATAPHISDDPEWQARIAHHRLSRATQWRTLEEELDLVKALQMHATQGEVVLLDCLTLWLSNLIFAGRDPETETTALCELLPTLAGHVILVSNEVGMGLVPEHSISRRFRDAQGRLNQAVAAIAECVEFVVAGLPLQIK